MTGRTEVGKMRWRGKSPSKNKSKSSGKNLTVGVASLCSLIIVSWCSKEPAPPVVYSMLLMLAKEPVSDLLVH